MKCVLLLNYTILRSHRLTKLQSHFILFYTDTLTYIHSRQLTYSHIQIDIYTYTKNTDSFTLYSFIFIPTLISVRVNISKCMYVYVYVFILKLFSACYRMAWLNEYKYKKKGRNNNNIIISKRNTNIKGN